MIPRLAGNFFYDPFKNSDDIEVVSFILKDFHPQ